MNLCQIKDAISRAVCSRRRGAAGTAWSVASPRQHQGTTTLKQLFLRFMCSRRRDAAGTAWSFASRWVWCWRRTDTAASSWCGGRSHNAHMTVVACVAHTRWWCGSSVLATAAPRRRQSLASEQPCSSRALRAPQSGRCGGRGGGAGPLVGCRSYAQEARPKHPEHFCRNCFQQKLLPASRLGKLGASLCAVRVA